MYQWGDKGWKRIITYISKVLSPFEKDLDINELGDLAAIKALDKFRGFTQGCKIKLLTDNRAISFLLTTSSPSEKQVRWRLAILQNDVTFHHVKGDDNDDLSRVTLTVMEVKKKN